MGSEAINQWQRNQFLTYEEKYQEYLAGRKTDETLIEPIFKNLIQGAITPQALIKSLKIFPEIFISTNEGGSFVGSHSMQEQAMQFFSLLNMSWDGTDLRNNTQGNGFICAVNPRGTVNLSMQPNVYYDFINNGQAKGIGFLARFLTATPISLMGTRLYKEPNSLQCEAYMEFSNRITKLLNTERNYEFGHLKPTLITLSPEAKKLWIDFYNITEKQLGLELESIKSWGAKCADNVSRLACQFQIFKDNKVEVDQECMVSAIRVMEYYLNEQLRLEQSSDLINKKKMLEWLIKECKSKSYLIEYEIKQKCPNQFRNSDPTRKAIIENLILEGMLQRKQMDKTYIFVHPELLV